MKGRLVHQRKKRQILTFVLTIQSLGWPRFHWLIDPSMCFSFLPASPSLALSLFFVFLFFLATMCSLWDLSSLIRDCALGSESGEY